MSLLLLFAGGGVQAPAPPAVGDICGATALILRPGGTVLERKPDGLLNADRFIMVLLLSSRPKGQIALRKPDGTVTECE